VIVVVLGVGTQMKCQHIPHTMAHIYVKNAPSKMIKKQIWLGPHITQDAYEMKFYTSFSQYRNQILVRGYEDGKPFKERINYAPYLFLPSKDESAKFHALDGTPVEKFEFDSISEAKEFINKYKDVENFPIYGLTNWQYLYVYDFYKGQIQFDHTLIRVANMDIEVAASPEDGFPDIALADKEVTAITIRIKGETFAFGCGEFVVPDTMKNTTYIKCKNEIELLHKFLNFWTQENFFPDVITGWNVAWFDVPYLINRIARVLSLDDAKRMSPWGLLFPKSLFVKGKEQQTYNIIGITVLDELDLYKKFSYTPQESYKLDHVAFEEVGEQKIDYSEYGDLLGLYKKNFQKFMEYNIRDTLLVELIENKHRFLELVFSMAYDAKVNFEDTLKTVRPWDVIIHNFLLQRSIVISQYDDDNESANIPGGFVKNPPVGEHHWVVSFDLDSLYPHLIMQYNISPDVFLGVNNPDYFSIEDILNGSMDKYREQLVENNISVTANMACYSKDKHGFLAEIMDTMYKQRVEYKKKMIEYQKEYEKTKDESLKMNIAKFKNFQLVKKIQMNSVYGAIANPFFRMYNSDMAASITTSGQLTILWVMRDINKYLNKILGTEDKDYVLAADTDSVYLCLEDLVDKIFGKGERDNFEIVKFLDKVCEEKIGPVIRESYDRLYKYMNAYDSKMNMKREAISNKGVWTGAKNYMLNVYNNEGVQYDKPKLKMVGIAAVKTSYPKVCRDALKSAIEIIMNKTEGNLISYVSDFRDKFMEMPVEMIASPRGINNIAKFIDGPTYKKGSGVHVRGAINYNNLLISKGVANKYQPIGDGDKIKFIYLKMPNPVHDDVIGFLDVLPPEFNLEKYINRKYQFEKTFLQPLHIITDAIKWKTEKKLTVEDFF
jgi:DNA polymerase elongation subunit (family B)